MPQIAVEPIINKLNNRKKINIINLPILCLPTQLFIHVQ
jgi:hypothetical protein